MKVFFAVIPLLLLAGCSGSIDPLEPPAALTTIVTPQLEVSHRWVRQLGKGSGGYYLKLAPQVDGERVFAASQSGRVEAFRSSDGERLWRTELGTPINAGPGADGELLLFGGDAEVIALNKQEGSPRWRTPVSSEVLSIPRQRAGIVVVHSVDGNITALDADSGERLWQHRESVPTLSLRGSGDPLMLDDAVLVGTANGKVVALRLADGGVLWEAVVSEPRGRTELERIVDVDGDLALADGVVYASSHQGRLAAIALNSGQLLWSRDIAAVGGIVLDRDSLYVADVNGDLWSLSRRDGDTMWKQDRLHQRGLTAPVQQGNYLVVADFEGYLHWLDKREGTLVARVRIRNFAEYWPVDDEEGTLNPYKEDHAALMPPAIEGVEVFGLDKRGVLDAFHVTPIAREAD